MKIIRKNIPFLLLLLVILFCFVKKNTVLTEEVTIHNDTVIMLGDGDALSQTWSPHTRRITGVFLPYTAPDGFSGGVTLTVTPDYPGGAQESVITCSLNQLDMEAGNRGTLFFDFDTVTLIPGKRYCFTFTCTSAGTEESLQIPASSEYGGCAKNNGELSAGLSMTIQFVKSSRLFMLFSIFMPILIFALFLMLLFRRRFEETVALALVILIAVLYVAGLAGHLEAGIRAVYLFTGIAAVLSVLLYNKKGICLKELISPGLLVFASFSVLILLYNAGMERSSWDEFSHWGMAVKDMYYFNSFSKHAESTVSLIRYPPFVTLFQYFAEYQNGLFSENLLYVAFQILLLGFLIAGIRNISFRNIRLLPTGLAISLLVPVIFFPSAFNLIMVDPMLAVIAAYVLFCYYTEPMSVFNFLRIAGGLFALVLTKEMGFPLAGMLSLVLIADGIYKKGKLRNRGLIPLCALTCVALLVFASWRLYLAVPVSQENPLTGEIVQTSGTVLRDEGEASAVETVVQTDVDKFAPEKLLELMKGNAPEWRYRVIKSFIAGMFSGSSYSLGILQLSVFDVLFLLLLAALFLSRSHRFGTDRNIRSLCIFGSLGCLPYLGFLLICYLFAFDQEEAEILHSCARYAASYVAAPVLALLQYIYFELCRDCETGAEGEASESAFRSCLAILLVLCIISPIENLTNKNLGTETDYEYLYGVEDAERVLRSFADQSEQVYLVCNDSQGFSYYVFRNAVIPLRTQVGDWNIFSSREDYLAYETAYLEEPDPRACYLSTEEWADRLAGDYEYVFLLHPNDFFADMYGELFEDPDTIDNGMFYKVRTGEDGQVILSPIGKIGVKRWK